MMRLLWKTGDSSSKVKQSMVAKSHPLQPSNSSQVSNSKTKTFTQGFPGGPEVKKNQVCQCRAQTRSLVQEDPTFLGATKPGTTLLRLCAQRPCSKESHHNKQPRLQLDKAHVWQREPTESNINLKKIHRKNFTHVHSSNTHNSQKVETPQMSIK